MDDGTLSSLEAKEQQRRIGLRWNHIGLSLPGQVLRLDPYRLVCYFQTSEYLASLSDGGDFCPWQGLRDEFQDSEIARILLQTAVAVRFIGAGHADEMRAQKDWLEDSVGKLYKVGEADSQPLPLREACNKIIREEYRPRRQREGQSLRTLHQADHFLLQRFRAEERVEGRNRSAPLRRAL